VQKAFKYRFFPTDEQAVQLARTFGCARYVYNQALEYRTKAWQQEKKSIGYHTTAAKLTEWKKEPEKAFLSEVSSVVLQQSLRNLDTAFTNFFEKRAQYPKFKSRGVRQSARYATNAFTFPDQCSRRGDSPMTAAQETMIKKAAEPQYGASKNIRPANS